MERKSVCPTPKRIKYTSAKLIKIPFVLNSKGWADQINDYCCINGVVHVIENYLSKKIFCFFIMKQTVIRVAGNNKKIISDLV